MNVDPVVIHAVSDDAVARTYSSYTPVRVDAQANSVLGVRTFRFNLGSDIILAPADAISLTLTELTSNQSTNITAVRWSSTIDSWLNTVYPIGAGEYTDGQARDAVNIRVVRNNLLFNDADDTAQTFSGGGGSTDHIPYWSADALYNTGDTVAQRIPATPPAFPNPATFTFVYNGADGTNTGEPVDPSRVCLLYTSPSPRDS